MALLFAISALAVLPFWALMIFAPHWPLSKAIIHSPWIAVVPVVIYALVALPLLKHLLPFFFRPSLAGLQAFAGTEFGALLFWAHVSAFDLLVGRYIYFDALERGISFWWVSPILFVTILFGPLGMGLYLALTALLPLLLTQ